MSSVDDVVKAVHEISKGQQFGDQHLKNSLKQFGDEISKPLQRSIDDLTKRLEKVEGKIK